MLYFLTEFGERGTISWSVLNWSRFAKYALCESERNEFFSKFLFCVLCCFVFIFAFLARDTMKRGQPEQKVRLTVLSPKAALWGGVGENIVLVNFPSSVTHSLIFLPCGVKPRMIFGFFGPGLRSVLIFSQFLAVWSWKWAIAEQGAGFGLTGTSSKACCSLK